MSFDFQDQCSTEHLETVQKNIDECRNQNDNVGLRRWVLYLGTLKTKCGIIQRSCKGCNPLTQRLNPCESCKATPPEAMHTMHGLTEYELVQNSNGQVIGMDTYKPKKPKSPRLEPLDHHSALLFNSRNQNRATETEK